MDHTRALQRFGVGAGRKQRKRAARRVTVLSFGVSPTAALPQASLHRTAEELGLMFKRRYGITFRAEGFTRPRWGGIQRQVISSSQTSVPVGEFDGFGCCVICP